MKINHSARNLHDEDFAESTIVGTHAYLDSSLEIHTEEGTIVAIGFDPAQRFDMALCLIEESDAEIYHPGGSWMDVKDVMEACSVEELEWVIWRNLKALKLKKDDELARKRRQKQSQQFDAIEGFLA